MSDMISEYQKSGLVSDRPWWEKFTCGECANFTGEECDGCTNEGNEAYADDMACREFEDAEEER